MPPQFEGFSPIKKLKVNIEKLAEGFNMTKPSAFDPWKEIEAILETFANNHRPDSDLDNDTFSFATPSARGYNWKGRDCDDGDARIYPGRSVNPFTNMAGFDYNCNGINGKNPKTGNTYKQDMCGNSGQIGFAVVGDSVGAHFELPEPWFNGSQWTNDTFDDFVPRALDEFDRPHYSGWSGYMNSTIASYPMRSIYNYLYQRNKCNYKDYQNCGINGASSNDILSYVQDCYRRNQTTDNPTILIIELVGNDVCPGGTGMTNVSNFETAIVQLLNYFDTILPNGSHVITVGLADGQLLYETLYNKEHPIGRTYEEVYDWLTCLDKNPCIGWLNSNAEVRNYTTQRAQNLTQVYKNLKASGLSFQNFDWDYMDFPADQIFDAWTEEGEDPVLLIEPVDGFHPSQIFHALMADWYWQQINATHPDWLGSVNPYNSQIEQIFGNQGGYGPNNFTVAELMEKINL